jgi:hypothetical protein
MRTRRAGSTRSGMPQVVRLTATMWALVAIIAAFGGATPATARAAGVSESAPVMRLVLVGHEVAERIVSVEVAVPEECRQVVLYSDGVEVRRLAVLRGAASVVATVAVGSHVAALTAAGFDAVGRQVSGTTEPLVVDPVVFAPSGPRVRIARERTVLPGQEFSVRFEGVTHLSATLRGYPFADLDVAALEQLTLRLPASADFPYGRSWLSVTATNAWGSRSATLPIWNLRWLPETRQAVLVDKSDFQLYWISYGRVAKVYPIAIGMPGTQTPLGRFWLGRPRPASGAWGVLKMPLMRSNRWGHVRPFSNYAIHGTNQPDTIGTQASHGCVRMYNSGVRDLARRVGGHSTTVLIRR